MTIEERAIAYQGKLASSFLGFPDLLEGGLNGYIQGATEQKAIDIDKACEWLMKYFVIDHEGMSPSECDIFLRKFRKAMED